MNVSPELENAIHEVFEAIGYDLPEDIDNIDAVEVCLDANRLESFGHSEEYAEFQRLLEQNSYEEVLPFIAEVVTLV